MNIVLPRAFIYHGRLLASALFVAVALCLPPATMAQWIDLPRTGSQPATLPDRTVLAGQSGLAPQMTAELVHAKANARHRSAVVAVKTEGVHLTTPASSQDIPWLDEAHLSYQLDNLPPLFTTNLSMEFHNLAPGVHQILVALVGNDDRPIGAPQTLKLHVR